MKLLKLKLHSSFAAIASLGVAAVLAAMPATVARSQTQSGALTVRSDVQQADAKTGIVTASGNVQIDYPSRNIQAWSNQAQYFSRERRIILTGDVFVLQDGNTIEGETVTYQLDTGIFIALPQVSGQVESKYLIPEGGDPSSVVPPAPAIPSFEVQ